MKRLRFKKTALIIILALFSGFSLRAGEDEYSKKLHKEYAVTAETQFNIINKYGDVNITNWDKNQVVIDVVITVDHRREEKARELLEYLNVNFTESENTITAETEIDDKFNKSGWFFNFDSDNKDFSIDYTIKMPSKLNLAVENKYGNVFIDEVTGHADITVKYGNLKANKVMRDNSKPLSHVYLAYSDGTVEESNWLKITLKYSKLEIDESKALIAVTKYSKLYNDKTSSLVCESKYDHYYLGTISNLVAEAKYTDFKIDQLNKKLDIETRYGDLEIDHVPASFEDLTIDNKYGHLDIEIDNGASYKLKGEAEYGDIDYPSDSKLSRIEENSDLRISGTVGKDQNTKSTVTIDTKYGSVDLK